MTVSEISITYLSYSGVEAQSKFSDLKSVSHLPKKIVLFTPLKVMKNAFYFILQALFVLKVFKFLSWLFGHVEKKVWLEIQG